VKALSSESRLTANMLVLELSTMIVAIALAFHSEAVIKPSARCLC